MSIPYLQGGKNRGLGAGQGKSRLSKPTAVWYDTGERLAGGGGSEALLPVDRLGKNAELA